MYYGSSALRNVKILGKDTKLEDNSFYNCSHLQNVDADEKVFNNADCRMFIKEYDSDYMNQVSFAENNITDGLFIIKNKLVLDKHRCDCDTPKYSDNRYDMPVVHNRNRIIPEGVKVIGKGAFYGAYYKNIVIPNSLEKIEKDAFKNNDIKSIYIPNKNVVIEDGAFDDSVKIYKGDNKPADMNSLIYSYTQDGKLEEYYGNDKVVEIPSSINGTKITSIGGGFEWQSAWQGGHYNDNSTFNMSNNNVEKVIIPEGVIEIDDYAFFNCYSLKEVVIPSTVKKISDTAFYGCENLIKITTNNTKVDTNCKEYQDVLKNNGAQNQKIYNGFIYSDSGTGVVVIEGYSGQDKKLVVTDKIDGKVVNSVSGINGNNNIEEVVIPKSVKYVSDFCDCTSLLNVTIDEGTNVSYNTFLNTPYIKNMCENNNGLFIWNGNLLYIKDGIQNLIVPKSVKEMSILDFQYSYNIRNLKEIDLCSETEIYLKSDHDIVKCKTIDDYREFAKQIQDITDYYFTLKLDGNVIWSNEEGVGTDTPDDKNRPDKVEISKTADAKNIIVPFILLSSSLIAVFKLKKKTIL